jgi:hypothetical protein
MTLRPEQENWDEFHDVDIVNWKRVRSALEHENLLMNHRLTWLLSSQAFLFAAFAIIFQVSTKIDVDSDHRVLYQIIMAYLAATGFLVALYIQRHIRTAEIQHGYLVKWWEAKGLDKNAHPPICGGPSGMDRLLLQSNFPFLFAFAWCAFGFTVIGNVILNSLNTYAEIIKAFLAVLGTGFGLLCIGIRIGRQQSQRQ